MTRYFPPICLGCKHLQTKIDEDQLNLELKCDAFPIIPKDIIFNQFDHKMPHPDDNGIQFEAVDRNADKYAERLFS